MLTKTANLSAHLEKILTVGFYAAPDEGTIQPFLIREGTELVELLTGGKVFFQDVGGNRTLYGKGSIFWHQAGEQTICESCPGSPYRCMVFQFAVSQRARPVPRVGFWRQTGKLEEFCSEAMRLYSEGADAALSGAYFYGTLLRQFCIAGEGVQPEYPESLNRVLRYIEDNHGRNASVRKLCSVGCVGQAQLFRLFRNFLGSTPRDYAHDKLMGYARLLLLSNNLSIKETAEECGYAHLEVFYRNFLHANGMTPGEYRRRQAPYRNGQADEADDER